ncbi:Squalene epoxidase [Pseudogymnoascus verrucosus]|uniref:Squalene monooxygenase n=1 Tax=Pseudogymnoascus verrucosus TaxID=342668 RepID=A0A1B8GH66_9PEZI|nr:Squalene epoxidase [Pseudogymnoascus verrucosus]OBT95162.1 Squalene epoxidase [Pseudogymnoascus verrucosus]
MNTLVQLRSFNSPPTTAKVSVPAKIASAVSRPFTSLLASSPIDNQYPSMTATQNTHESLEQRRTMHHEADVVIVGAGVFGCAAAVTLARQGRSVILLERSMKEPNRIVGELLQPGGVSALHKLGLSECLEGIDAVVVNGYNVIYYGKEVHIPYPYDTRVEKSRAMKESRPVGWCFHHGRFINKLREACKREPNITIFETTVKGTVSTDNNEQVLGVKTETTDPIDGSKKPDYFFGGLTIAADGYASTLRKQYISKTPVAKSKFYALELIDCPIPVPNHGHIILSDNAPVLVYQIGTHETRALIDVPENLESAKSALGGVKAHIRNVVVPTLPEAIKPTFIKALEEGGLRSMPNSWLPPTQQQTPGIVVLGDAMNMRHPLTGGGMSVALTDVVILSELLHPTRIADLSSVPAMSLAMRTFHWRRKQLTSIVNILAQALYALFAANNAELKALQRGCFEYFLYGGVCVEEPAGMLACILPRPFLLFYHFFSVALLAMWLIMCDCVGNVLGVWKAPLGVYKSGAVLVKAVEVIFPYIFSELKW